MLPTEVMIVSRIVSCPVPVADGDSKPVETNSLYKQFKRFSFWLKLAGLYPWQNVNAKGSPPSRIKCLISWLPAGVFFLLMIATTLERLIVACIHGFHPHNPVGFAAELRMMTMIFFRTSVTLLIPLSCYKTRKIDKLIQFVSKMCDDVFRNQQWNRYYICVTAMLMVLVTFFSGYYISASSYFLLDVLTEPHTWNSVLYSFTLLIARICAMHTRLIFYVMVMLLVTAIGLQFSVYFHDLKKILRKINSNDQEQKKGEIETILANHFTLSRTVEKVDKILSPLFLVTVPFDLATTIFLVAHLFEGSSTADSLAYRALKSSFLMSLLCVFDFCWMMFVLFGPIVASAYLKQQAESIVKEITYFLGQENADVNLKAILKRRIDSVKDFPPVLSLGNIAPLDKTFLLVVLGILGTYLFIILEVSQWYVQETTDLDVISRHLRENGCICNQTILSIPVPRFTRMRF